MSRLRSSTARTPKSQITPPGPASCGEERFDPLKSERKTEGQEAVTLTSSLGVCSGGRKIKVMGNGFDLIQRATMRVLPSTDEFSEDTSPAEVRRPQV